MAAGGSVARSAVTRQSVVSRTADHYKRQTFRRDRIITTVVISQQVTSTALAPTALALAPSADAAAPAVAAATAFEALPSCRFAG